MSLEAVIAWVLTGMLAGALMTTFLPGRGYGSRMDILLGVVGACLGGLATSSWTVGAAGLPLSVFSAVAGAVVLTKLARNWPGRTAAGPAVQRQW
jgi:uncharacterized membrane protein YeaQ/YmgE (transglycosylase-associated protein family)